MSSWFKMSLLGGAETTVRLVIKSWWGLAWVTPFWTCCFLLSIKDSLKAKQGFRWAITICPNMTSAFNFSSGMWLTLLILGRRRGVKSTVALERECKARKLAHQLLEGPSLSCSVCTAVEALELLTWEKFKKGWSARAMHQILKAGTWLTDAQHSWYHFPDQHPWPAAAVNQTA